MSGTLELERGKKKKTDGMLQRSISDDDAGAYDGASWVTISPKQPS